MPLDRKKLYRFPWSKTDNPGGWIEVTDECNLICQGCYRAKLEGHRPLDEIKADILQCRRITNCDGITISGGEPLLYPHILEVVDFISNQKLKSLLFTNGEGLTPELALELKKAGLVKIHFHIDSGQERPAWKGKSEIELNELRQHYADMIWNLGGIRCGFHQTVYRSTLQSVPDVVGWCLANIQKVQHLSVIALRGFPQSDHVEYWVGGQKLDIEKFPNSFANEDDIRVMTEEMFELVGNQFPDLYPGAYLNGTAAPQTNKYLVFVNIGSRGNIFGGLGAKSLELVQIFFHLFQGRYPFFTKNSKVGRKVFLLSLVDREVGRALKNYMRKLFRNPSILFRPVYAQSLVLQQPIEIIEGQANHCDGCVNMMIHKGRLINSCRLDELRLYGSLIQPVEKKRPVL